MDDGVPVELPGSVLLRGSTTDPGKEIFIGIAPRADVAAYLAGVRRNRNRRRQVQPLPRAVPRSGRLPGPVQSGAAELLGRDCHRPGEQELTWDLRSGAWAVVVMNADATSPVSVNLQAGARTDLLLPVFIGLLIGGLVMLLIGVPLIVLGAVGLGRGGPGPAGRSGALPGTCRPSPASRIPRGPYPPRATPGQQNVAAPPGAVAAYAAAPGTPYPVATGCCDPIRVPRPPPRLPRPEPVTVDVAREVVPGHPALHRPVHPLVRLRSGHDRGVVRDPVHGALPALAVQFQCRRDPLELACGLLRLQRDRHGRLSALHPGPHRLPGGLRRRLSRTAVPRPGAGEVVAAGHSASADCRRC